MFSAVQFDPSSCTSLTLVDMPIIILVYILRFHVFFAYKSRYAAITAHVRYDCLTHFFTAWPGATLSSLHPSLYNKYLLISFFSLSFPLFESRRLSAGSYQQRQKLLFSAVSYWFCLMNTRRSCTGFCLGRNAHRKIYIGRNRARDESVYVRSCTIRLTAWQKQTEPLFPCNWI